MIRIAKNNLLIMAGLLALLILIGTQWFLWRAFKHPGTEAKNIVACDIRRHCILSNGAMIQAIGKLNAKQDFRLVVHQAPVQTQKIYVEFSMKDMDMGFNRYQLLQNPQNPTQWTASSIRLPVCVVARRDYIMTLVIDNEVFEIPFMSE